MCAAGPTIDRPRRLNETSVLMAQQMISGRDAVEVIDELEVLFRRHYEKLAEKRGALAHRPFAPFPSGRGKGWVCVGAALWPRWV
jgi:hypothetical protein